MRLGGQGLGVAQAVAHQQARVALLGQLLLQAGRRAPGLFGRGISLDILIAHVPLSVSFLPWPSEW